MKQEVVNYEYAISQTEKLFIFLSNKLGEKKVEKSYISGYYSYTKESQLGECQIKIKNVKGFINTHISFSSYFSADREKPFVLRLWKYNGEHFFKNIDLTKEETSENMFERYWEEIQKFFGLESKQYEQLNLFDFTW